MAMENKVILLVHTQARLREQIAGYLNSAGITNIIACDDGESAVDMLLHRVFDVVICDVNLKQIDGWQLARLIRSGALNTSKETPVFVVSDSYSEHLSRVTAQEFDVNAFVSNSAMQDLPELIQNAIEKPFADMHVRRLLVIEDYAETVALVERTLAADFKIESVMDGAQGLAAWKSGRHDLVLLDVMLPGLSGEEVLREIRAIDSHQPVVMMTAHTSGELAARLFKLGCVDFVVKPFRTSMLRRVCQLAIRRDDYMTSHQQIGEYQSALFDEKERVRVVLDSIGDGIISSDKQGIPDYLNHRAMELLEWHPPQSLQAVCEKMHACGDTVTHAGATSGQDSELTHVVLQHQGEDCHLDVKTTAIVGYNGELAGRVSILHDVTAHTTIASQLRHESMHDPLTGLLNRAGFRHALNMAHQEMSAFKVSHALCYMDLDKFKQVNDKCGHDVGDFLLRSLCDIFRKTIRHGSDALSRLGGDEFALLLKNCSLEKAQAIANTLCDEVSAYELEHDGTIYHVGVSIGLVMMKDFNEELDAVIKRADQACYAAKHAGRGRVVVM